ncbi:MAG: hypothetical protein FJ263_00540 [Planctomycetes bacterium]|nr:hypothetical protein [Planctomycetota bacterium]
MGKCPHCEKDVTLKYAGGEAQEILRQVQGLMKKEVMYVCPHCRHILGFGRISWFLTGQSNK